eukprot:scaffold31_cov312-Prasinococcus_capsulatus_cf.AAC.3
MSPGSETNICPPRASNHKPALRRQPEASAPSSNRKTSERTMIASQLAAMLLARTHLRSRGSPCSGCGGRCYGCAASRSCHQGSRSCRSCRAGSLPRSCPRHCARWP